MNRHIYNTAYIAFMLLVAFGCVHSALAGVTKSRLGSLTRNDTVVTDIDLSGIGTGGVNTGDVRKVVEDYDTSVIVPREADIYSALQDIHVYALTNIIAMRYTLNRIAPLEWELVSRFNKIRDTLGMLGMGVTPEGPYLWSISTLYEDQAGALSRLSGTKRTADTRGVGVCNNRYHGRNFDGPYNSNATFVVRSAATGTRFGVIGVSDNVLDDRLLHTQNWRDPLAAVTMALSDGMNDRGVVIQRNTIPRDASRSASWRTSRAGGLTVFAVVRYVLDRCATALDAANMLRDIVFVPGWAPHDFQFLVSDRTSSYIVEDGVIVGEPKPSDVITGFRVTGVAFGPYFPTYWTVEPYGTGLERYTYAKKNIASCGTMEGITGVMTNLWYSNTYRDGTDWYTEYCVPGSPVFNVREAYTNETAFAPRIAELSAIAASERTPGSSDYRGGKTLHTSHTAIYDKEQLSMYVYAQEDASRVYTFSLPATSVRGLGGVKGVEFQVEQGNTEMIYAALTNLIIRLGGSVAE